jgi:hypothetical protein
VKRAPVVLVALAVAGSAALGVAAFAGDDGATPKASDATPTAQAEQQARADDELAAAVRQEAEKFAKHHELRVTIRDKPAPDDPDAADAYVAKSARECSAIVWGEDSEQLGHLVVNAPDEQDELETVGSFDLPATARLLPDGTCEAALTIRVPYASRYVLGVAITGRGIKPENAPEPPVVITKGDSQSVVVVK